MWVGMMMVPMVMPVMIIMVMMVVILVEAAGPGAEMIAKWAILDIASGCRDALPLDMVMVAFLRETNLVLEAQHLRPVFA